LRPRSSLPCFLRFVAISGRLDDTRVVGMTLVAGLHQEL
jgi:hypothetical protein